MPPSPWSWMAAILGTLFLGISYDGLSLSASLPKEDETVVSQVARAIFGEGFLYYLVQGTTMLILVLAANSAFAGFPRLASTLGPGRIHASSDGHDGRSPGVFQRHYDPWIRSPAC